MSAQLDDEVDRNFDAFRSMLPGMIGDHRGEFVLLRHRNVEGFFGDLRAAFAAGSVRFGDRLFSVQEVTDRPADLGFFSHAVDTRLA